MATSSILFANPYITEPSKFNAPANTKPIIFLIPFISAIKAEPESPGAIGFKQINPLGVVDALAINSIQLLNCIVVFAPWIGYDIDITTFFANANNFISPSPFAPVVLPELNKFGFVEIRILSISCVVANTKGVVHPVNPNCLYDVE